MSTSTASRVRWQWPQTGIQYDQKANKMNLNIFSGGAAQAVVTGLQHEFEQTHGCKLVPTFGAVGAMRDRLVDGEPCDLLVLSASLIDQLMAQGRVVQDSARVLGRVATGIAVPVGATSIDVRSAVSLKAALSAARGVYVPDLRKSTAGIHIARMLAALGLDDVLAGRIREYPNGATAMRELAKNGSDGMVGCTQVTEIMYTPGVQLVGELPAEHALSTIYTAAVCSQAQQPALAEQLAQVLSGEASVTLRRRSGFGV